MYLGAGEVLKVFGRMDCMYPRTIYVRRVIYRVGATRSSPGFWARWGLRPTVSAIYGAVRCMAILVVLDALPSRLTIL